MISRRINRIHKKTPYVETHPIWDFRFRLKWFWQASWGTQIPVLVASGSSSPIVQKSSVGGIAPSKPDEVCLQ